MTRNFFVLATKKANLYDGHYHDFGTDENDLTFRMYGVKLMDNEVDPSYYIQFLVYSYSTQELVEGSYIYDFVGERGGTFSYFKAGVALRRDHTGNYIAGEVYNDSYGVEILEGSIDLSRDRSQYVFDIYAMVVKNNDTVEVEGYYHGYLQDQPIEIFEDEE